jgi:hypothetical protein
MKRIQIFKASIVALAIGGAFISKANSRFIQTYYTLNTSPSGQPCTAETFACGATGLNCTAPSGTATKTYYHLDASSHCTVPLKRD